MSENKQLSEKTLEFLQKLKDKGYWNNNYDYSEVDYVNTENKIIVIDNKFNSKHLISPHKILSRNTKCSIINCINKEEYLIKEFNYYHGNKYDYSKVNYTGAKNDVIIICKKHGEFNQQPTIHKSGSGCPKCGQLQSARMKVKSEVKKGEEFAC